MSIPQAMNPGGRATALVSQQDGPLVPATLLGQSTRSRISVAGRIRAGIMVLTRKAEESPDARELYAAGVAAGKGFETIRGEISAKVPDLARPLTPKNVPYFTVRGEDFPNPALAQQIMDLYAEDRGDGVQRLYRFPVVFPADLWQHVMPHEMAAWRTNEKLFWSEYSPDGATRYCKTYAPVPTDANGKRAIRIFGGRKPILRAENNGICEPEQCEQYQRKQCNLTGRFIFFIPGIRSISAFDLPTNSFYAMQAAIEKFTTVAFMRGGRIAGFLDGSRTSFYLTKRLVDVSRIDDEGRAVRTPQWLIELEAPVDPTALLRGDEGMEGTDVRAAQAAARLGEAAGRRVDEDGVIDIEPPVPPTRFRPETADGRADKTAPPRQEPVRETRRPPAARSGPHELGDTSGSAKPASARGRSPGGEGPELQRVFEAAQRLNVDAAQYQAYADKRFGTGWKLSANGRKRALDEILWFGDDEGGFREKLKGEETFN